MKRKFKPLDPEQQSRKQSRVQQVSSYENEEDYYAYQDAEDEMDDFAEVAQQFNDFEPRQNTRYNTTSVAHDEDLIETSQFGYEESYENPRPNRAKNNQRKLQRHEVELPPRRGRQTRETPQNAPTKKPQATRTMQASGSKLGIWAIILTTAVIVVVVGFMWSSNNSGAGFNAISGTSVIQSNNIEWKVRPEDTGGQTMPFEDLAILNPSQNSEILQQHVDYLSETQPQSINEVATNAANISSEGNDIAIVNDNGSEGQLLDLEDVLRMNQ